MLKGNQIKDVSWPENRKCLNILVCRLHLGWTFNIYAKEALLFFFLLWIYAPPGTASPFALYQRRAEKGWLVMYLMLLLRIPAFFHTFQLFSWCH